MQYNPYSTTLLTSAPYILLTSVSWCSGYPAKRTPSPGRFKQHTLELKQFSAPHILHCSSLLCFYCSSLCFYCSCCFYVILYCLDFRVDPTSPRSQWSRICSLLNVHELPGPEQRGFQNEDFSFSNSSQKSNCE